MTRFRGGRWPDGRQMLLLRAATAPADAAVSAWQEWLATGHFDDIDGASVAVVPQVYEHLRAGGRGFDESGRLHGIQRRQWYKNRVAMHALADAASVLGAAGIEAMALKGAALLLSIPGVSSSRGMNDVDLLVRPEDAVRAAEELLAVGWQRSWPRTPEPSRVFEVMHALELRNVSGAALDLHRQMLEDNRAPGMDRGAWKRARRMTVEGAEVRVPSPEDLLVMVCVHGLRATPTRTIRWVLDVLAIIEAFGGELEWDVVLRIARQRKVTLAMAESLEFVRNEFGAGVPESTLAALRGAKRGWVERVDYRAQGRKERATWAVASTFTRYLRQADGNGMVAGVRKGPGFLRALWGLERTRDIPLDGWRRVQAIRARRSYWRERRERELKTG